MMPGYFFGLVREGRVERAIGMSRGKFNDLLPVFTASYDAAEQEGVGNRLIAGNRDGDRRGSLDSPEKGLFFILYYLNNTPSFDALGLLFGIGASDAYDYMIVYMRVLRRGLEILAVAPHLTLDSICGLREALDRFAERNIDSPRSERVASVGHVANGGGCGGRTEPEVDHRFCDRRHWTRQLSAEGTPTGEATR